MATYSVDLMRRDVDVEYRFLAELEDALRIMGDLGYETSSDPEERERFRVLAVRVGDQKHKVHKLENLLIRSAR